MKRNKLPFIAALSIFAACALARAEVVDKIAIVVNSEIVTQGEIDRLMAPVYERYREEYKGADLVKKLEEVRQGIIQQLIEDKLILCEAKRLNIEVTEEEVDEKVRESMRRFGFSRDAFEAALKEQHISLKELKARYREQIMNRKLVDQKVGAKVTVTPIDVKLYYEAHKDQFVRPPQVRLRNILIRPHSPSDAQAAFAKAREVMRRLKEGCDFAGLARTYSEGPMASEGGLMGYSKKGDLLPEIENVVFKMKAAETSGIIQTSIGYHIFKVEEVLEASPLPLAEVRREAEEAVFRDKIKDKIKGWLEGLKKNAYIAFK